ncbi:hypothetical protein L0657_10865 [Dyadobacter sp. CY345]|uniref:hypothetical protein n=1 Tax=Dyadobacter sp. CY345 TaxID=2909335 RepID=UPI001F1BDF28|nr:hypothetical protein [Dyadobacter sp. CY345]MCF2444457.1 hypothetical protein [Dyadobacter sp. CY345]
MQTTYHIKVKKDYAASVIEDLQKMDAIEIIRNNEEDQVPEWQKNLVTQRIEKYKGKSELLVDENRAFQILDSE